MKAIRNSVFATVLAGLLVPAGIAVATGAVRSALRPDISPATAPQSESNDSTDDVPLKPKTEPKPEPKTEPKTEPVKDTTPPSLILFAPEKGSRVVEPVVTVKGAAETGSMVKVNGERVATDDRGRFQRDVKLWPGRNVLTIKAYDAAGNRTVIEAAVYYDAPVVEPKPEPKPEVDLKDFTANQKFGSSSQTPPYDIFFGTGKPGSAVKVKSEYGYVYTTIGEDGTWEVKLFFEGLDAGRTIPVWVKLDGIVVKEFHFTYTP